MGRRPSNFTPLKGQTMPTQSASMPTQTSAMPTQTSSAPITPDSAPTIISHPAAMPQEEKIEMALASMTLHPQDAPALREQLAKAQSEANRLGSPMRFDVEQADFAALPGTTLGESPVAGASNTFTPEASALADSLERSLQTSTDDPAKRRWEMNRAAAAAEAGVAVDNLLSRDTMAQRIAREKKYLVMVAPLPSDQGLPYVCGSINTWEYEVPIGVAVSLPYSVMAAMVEQGRCPAPPECPELIVQAIHAAHTNGSTVTRQTVNDGRDRNGMYLGGSAAGFNGRSLEAQIQESVYRLLNGKGGHQSLPASSNSPTRFSPAI